MDYVYLRATSPVEPAFGTSGHRTKVTNEPGSRAAGVLVERPAAAAA